MKPEGYPLPWCDRLDSPYWKINAALCIRRSWRCWQATKEMSAIIPAIDRIIRLFDREMG